MRKIDSKEIFFQKVGALAKFFSKIFMGLSIPYIGISKDRI